MTSPIASNSLASKLAGRSKEISQSGGEPIIQLEDVAVRYRVPQERIPTFKEYVIRWLRGQVRYQSFWALQTINLEVLPGEVFGIIGPNGAGKSTLLKVIARVLYPTRGRVRIRGQVAPLLELGAGFDAELTGRENVYLNGAILGHTKTQLDALLPWIIEFSGLQDFIDAPLRTYSTGMVARLGFSVATASRPDILIVDEILGVGDAEFQTKSFERIQSFQAAGTTILLVSHSLEVVEEICSRAMWLEHGEMVSLGNATGVIAQYTHSTQEKEAERLTSERQAAEKAIPERVPGEHVPAYAPAAVQATPASVAEHAPLEPAHTETPPPRWGSRVIEITGVHILGKADSKKEQGIFETGQPFILRLDFVAYKPVKEAIFGMAIHRQDGLHITGPNTTHAGLKLPELKGASSITYQVEQLPLLEGLYHVSVAVVNGNDSEIYDYHDRVYPFRVVNSKHSPAAAVVERYGLMTLGGTWKMPQP